MNVHHPSVPTPTQKASKSTRFLQSFIKITGQDPVATNCTGNATFVSTERRMCFDTFFSFLLLELIF